MPTYDYVCEKCGKEFEVVQSMKDERLEKCLDGACDGRMRRRIGTGAGVIFKGSGFYQTDYRSESYKAGASKEKAASSESKPAEGSGSEGKGAAKEAKKTSTSGGNGSGGGAPAIKSD